MKVQHNRLGIWCELLAGSKFQVDIYFNVPGSLYGLAFAIQVNAEDENEAVAKAYKKYQQAVMIASEEVTDSTLDQMFKRIDIVDKVKSAETYSEAFELIKRF
jgi:hypothetical protein